MTESAVARVIAQLTDYCHEVRVACHRPMPGLLFLLLPGYTDPAAHRRRWDANVSLFQGASMVSTTLLVFSGIFVAWSGGFILLWLYGQEWFLNFSVAGINMRDLFQVHPINLSVAVWVGFIALFGIASDDGVVIATYLDQTYQRRRPQSLEEIREATVEAGLRRIRPCLMTIATTVLALLPVMTSQGRGADVMVPMALPTFGGMLLALMTLFVVPVGYTAVRELKLRIEKSSTMI